MIKKILFASILVTFVACNGGNKAPVMAEKAEDVNLNQDASQHVANVSSDKKNVAVDHEEGVLTLAEVFENRKSLKGKQITVKGEVTKFNPAIMGKNWVHLQDGTEFSGQYDLTITTTEEVVVGSLVTFTGTLALDKDFGYGYKYATIVEGSILKK